MEELTCPFCGFKDNNSYFMLQHVALIHPENGESPFLVAEEEQSRAYQHEADGVKEAAKRNGGTDCSANSSGGSKKDEYVECPHECGEFILSTELSSHLDFHIAERMAIVDSGLPEVSFSTGPSNDEQAVEDIASHFSTDLPKSLRNRNQLQSSPSKTPTRRRTSLGELLFGSPQSPKHRRAMKGKEVTDGQTRRLGKAELGPYADERQMPTWLRKMLEEGARVTITNQLGPNGQIVRVEAIANETPGLVPILARLSDLDSTVERAFYCSPDVRHVAKMPKEGGFCGYRNIQMIISYIRDAYAPGRHHFEDKIPSILKLQDLIEQAWDMGYNSTGKIETGGIRLTRKYIGTPEAQAVFLSLAIRCEATAFSRSSDLVAHETLLLDLGEYFSNDGVYEATDKVTITNKAPIYFQHQGHSMTIVGLEIRKSGMVNLVVFDPMFNPSPGIKKLVGSSSFRASNPERLLRAHRRGESYLSRYGDFELLKLDPRQSSNAS